MRESSLYNCIGMRSSRKAFSLVELLTVIAVIGVIAALAIPALSGIIGKSIRAKEKHNAYTIAVYYASARAADAVFPTWSKSGIIDTLTGEGVRGTGKLADAYFKVSLSAPEISILKDSDLLEENAPGSPALKITYLDR